MLMIIMILRRSKILRISVIFLFILCVVENGVRRELDSGMRL
jgi:hypothetical protein